MHSADNFNVSEPKTSPGDIIIHGGLLITVCVASFMIGVLFGIIITKIFLL